MITLFLFFAVTGSTCLAQTYIERNYTVKDGLPSNNVYSVIQDHKGFLWFATNNGVCRFDGKEFKKFTAANGLPDNDIVNLAEDAVGRIWLSCFNSVPCYILDNRVVVGDSVCQKTQVSNNKGYFRFNPLGKKVLITFSAGSEAVLINEQGILTRSHLRGGGEVLDLGDCIVPVAPLYFGHFRLYKNKILIDSQEYWGPIKYTNETPVITSSPGTWDKGKFAVFMKDRQCFRFQVVNDKFFLVEKIRTAFPISKIYRYQDQLWAQVNNDSIVPVNTWFAPDHSRPTLFKNRLIQHFFADREGNTWACTAGNGVYMVPSKNVQLYETQNGLLSDNIQKLFPFDGAMYIGFNNTDIQVFDHTGFHTVEKEKTTALGKMRCLYVEKDYILFSALHDGFVVSKSNKKCFNISPGPAIKYVSKSRDNQVWLGTSGKCYKLQLPDKVTDMVPCGRVSCLLERSNGDLLAGGLHGILICRKMRPGHWQVDTFKAPVSLKELSISFMEEYDSTLVIGTSQKGLLLIRGSQYEFLGSKDMLKNANCKAMAIDQSRKTIWLATFSGLYRIKLKRDIHQYEIEDAGQHLGLPSLDVNDVKILDDSVYLGTSQGLIVFALGNTGLKKHKPPLVYINDIVVNDSVLVTQDQGFSLAPGKNNIEFRFSGIDYQSQGDILFRYRLSGLRSDWQYTRQNSVRYESLPPGDYRFEVAAMNTEQSWSPVAAMASFSILPFWWQTKLFLVSALLVFTVLVLIVSRSLLIRKHKILLKRASVKRHIAEVELKALKAQINPHFIFNTLNAIQYFITNGKEALADAYLGKLGKLLRKTLDFSSKTSVSLEEELRYIDNYLQLEQLRFEDNFTYAIENNVPAEKAHLPIPPMVLQPHIENALRHAFKGMQQLEKRITIRFGIKNNELVCEVEDNGIGRQASLAGKEGGAAEHVSHGQELSSSKLDIYEQLSGKKVSTSIRNIKEGSRYQGTVVIITLAI
ncbi:MAG: histidine kinase [Chitinophagaceae bacterium]|nr:histidine kinase [Chitinophagaceae bacterium]